MEIHNKIKEKRTSANFYKIIIALEILLIWLVALVSYADHLCQEKEIESLKIELQNAKQPKQSNLIKYAPNSEL